MILAGKADHHVDAWDQALKAHVYHYGKDKSSFTVQQDKVSTDFTSESGSIDRSKSLTYTVRFELEPPAYEAELAAFAQQIKRKLGPGTHTVLNFKVWLEKDHLCGYNAPVQCTASDCPVKHFHYKRLYLGGGIENSTPGASGSSNGPYEVCMAGRRLLAGSPSEGDEALVDAFNRYHAA